MKPLLLQTTPHSGTHTAMYLFRHLGGIPVFFMHFGDWKLDEFLEIFGEYRDRFVFLHMMRPYQDMVATYKKREAKGAAGGPNSAEALLGRNMHSATAWGKAFPEAMLLPLVGDNDLQGRVAEMVFKACGADVPARAKWFMETWAPKSTFPTGEEIDFRGFASTDEQQAMYRIMERFRILRGNDWRDKVNSCLRDLSH